MENDNFWKWPAATRVHHAYPGGLAKHSLNVAKNSLDIWKNYQGSNLDVALLVTGSLLHDIGKIDEYKPDGSRTTFGNLIPHPVSGQNKIIKHCLSIGVEPEKDKSVLMLLHTILSHHGKLEFGAPVSPYIAEAMIISKADDLDAVYDCMDSVLNNLTLNEASDRLTVIDGGKIFKWH
jgi:3'-5' exoribonuclease